MKMRCNKCHRPMNGTTANDGACECGGLIENVPQWEVTCPNPGVPVYDALIRGTRIGSYSNRTDAERAARSHLRLNW